MRRLRISLAVILLAVNAGLTQTPTELLTPAVKRVGDKLACKCGACNNTVGNCPMLQCHYAHPARQRIMEAQAQGMSDEAIIAMFVKEKGLSALSSPPAEGFSLLSWVMPFVALAIGLGMIWLYIRKFRKPALAVPVEPAVDARYRERIEKEMKEFD